MLKGIPPLVTPDLLHALASMGHGDEVAIVDAIPDPVADFAAGLADHDLGDVEMGRLDRQAFYERAREAYAVVRTGELRPYGNVLLVKGTVNRLGPR